MSDLAPMEKRKLERLFAMGDGYILNFSNRTFADFVLDSTGRNIYADKFNYGSGSKANRLRGFWTEEPNHAVAKLIADLLDYGHEIEAFTDKMTLLEDCRRIVARLQQNPGVGDADVFATTLSDSDPFDQLRSFVPHIAYRLPDRPAFHPLRRKRLRQRHAIIQRPESPTCPQLAQYKTMLNGRVAKASSEQETARTEDAIGDIALGIPFGSASHKWTPWQISDLKGRVVAVERVETSDSCTRQREASATNQL